MTGQKDDIFSGDGQKAPDNVTGQDADQAKGTARQGSAKAYDAIAYTVSIDSIKKEIEEFGSRHFTREYITFAFNLCDKVSITPDLDLLRGQKTIWAASIVHAIARLNFLFDANDELLLTPALICAYFKTNKSTVSNRASRIQKICGLEPGARGYCRQEIVDALALELPPQMSDLPAAVEEKEENPAMRILAYRRKQAEEARKRQALLGESKTSSDVDGPRPREEKQMKLFD